MTKLIPNLNTFADLCDRLAVEIHKLAWFENKKREEHSKDNPDVELISKWDNLSRDACEYRSLLKNEINKMLEAIVASKEYQTLNELRTFHPAKKSAVDLLVDMYNERANQSVSEEFAAALQKEFGNK